MNAELGLSLIILGGFLVAKLFRKARIPAVTAYVLLGIVMGPSGLDFIPQGILAASGFISDVVLGLIAFGIGKNFLGARFRQIGRAVMCISVMEALGAMVLVTLALLLLKEPLPIALIFGAIATATAPAATVMVIEEADASGPLTETLLGVVALDDAWCLIVFSLSMVVARSVAIGEETGVRLFLEMGGAFFEIAASIVMGAVFAWVLHHYSTRVKDPSDLEILILGIILFTVGSAVALDLSVLISCLALGVTLVNLDSRGFSFFEIIHPVDTPLYLIFFVLAGALLEVSVLEEMGLVGAAYAVFRAVGKIGGAYLGGSISGGTGLAVRRYVGLGLIPQAGVALGVALMARQQFPEVGDLIFQHRRWHHGGPGAAGPRSHQDGPGDGGGGCRLKLKVGLSRRPGPLCPHRDSPEHLPA